MGVKTAMMGCENQRQLFDKILKKYREYAALYASFNNGSLEGLTPFDEFYWRYTYYTRYDNPEMVRDGGY